MGSCISKCRPKKKFKEDFSHVHDKLVISQDPVPSVPQNITIKPQEKPLINSPAPSTSSTASSFSCSTNTKCTIASSASSSCNSSSLLSTKSFSNEFLWSCVKDNPHVMRINNPMTKEKTQNLDPSSFIVSPLMATKVKQSVQEKATPKKRVRPNSPTRARQKSFRKEHNSPTTSSIPNRGLRSPSPSRRVMINGSTNGTNKGNSVNSCLKRESSGRVPTPSPNSHLTITRNFPVRKKDTFSQQVGLKMDIVMEDIDNPLIALDCFIFL